MNPFVYHIKYGVLALLCCLCDVVAQAETGILPPIDTISVQEIVVTGARSSVVNDNMVQAVSILNSDDIRFSGHSSITDLLTEQVPGMFVTKGGLVGHSGYGSSYAATGSINMRGLSGSNGRTLILIDGHPQYAAVFGHPVADSYMSLDIERVEVSHGASSVLYGSGAMSAAINLISKNARQDGNHLSARIGGGSYDMISAEICDRYRKGKFSATLTAGSDNTSGHRENSAFNSNHAMLRIGYEISEHWNSQISTNLVRFYSENPGLADNPLLEGYAEIFRGVGQWSLSNKHDKTNGSLILYRSWGDHLVNDGFTLSTLQKAKNQFSEQGYSAEEAMSLAYRQSTQPYLFHSTDFINGATLYQSANLFKGNTLTLGLDGELYGGNAYRNPVTEIYADHIRISEVAAYATMRQELGRLNIHGGLRIENSSLYGYECIPQIGLNWRAGSKTIARISYSKGFRTPNLKELYMYAVANEELLPEECHDLDAGIIQYLADNKIRLELDSYVMKGDNMIEVSTLDGRRQNRNTGSFLNKGIEYSFSYDINRKWRLSGNGNYMTMKKKIVGCPEFQFFAKADYHSEKWRIQPSLMRVDRLYLSTGDNPTKTGYFLVNLKTSFQFNSHFGLFVYGDNLLNSTYETLLGMPMPGITLKGGIQLEF